MSVKIYVVDEKRAVPLADFRGRDELLEQVLTSESYERGVLPFDVMEARGLICFMRDEHLARFFHHLSKCQIVIPMDEDRLALYIRDALEDAKLPEAKVRVDVVMGEERSRSAIAVMIKVSPFVPAKSITLATAKYARPLPYLKLAGDYTFSQIKKRELYGVDDILYVDPISRRVTEASRANFFAIKYSGVHSFVYGLKNATNILHGITRQALKMTLQEVKNISLATSIQEAEAITIDELPYMDEVFVTSSGVRIAPVSRIDDLAFEIGHDKFGGRVTRELAAAFAKFRDDYYKRHKND